VNASWQDLLPGDVEFEGVSEDDFGPRSHIVMSACKALLETPWFAHVGEPLPNATVVIVKSWEEALDWIDEHHVDGNGHPPNLGTRLKAMLDANPHEDAWWRKAADELCQRFGYKPPKGRSMYQEGCFGDYMIDFAWWLAAEIIFDDRAGSTYFRELLAWFHAGRFPCGWEGDWPIGKLRVF